LQRFPLWLYVTAALVLTCGYWVWPYIPSWHDPDPLVDGVPARHNSDGTIDYTLIGPGPRPPNATSSPLHEWVIRLPKRNAALESGIRVPDTQGWIQLKQRRNNTLSLNFKIADMAPVDNFRTIKGSPLPENPGAFTMLIFAQVSDIKASGLADSYARLCRITGEMVDGLEVAAASPSSNECAQHAIVYLLRDPHDARKLLADFRCKTTDQPPYCEFRVVHRGRSIMGDIGFQHRHDFVAFTRRVSAFLDKSTLVDRVYPGTPFVQ
jgi:hypothetical protein